MFGDEIVYMKGWNCLDGILFKDYYNYFYNLRIILLMIYNFNNEIINFLKIILSLFMADLSFKHLYNFLKSGCEICVILKREIFIWTM